MNNVFQGRWQAWIFMIAWRFAIQSSKALPVTAAPPLLPHVGTVCPCRRLSASSGYSYTPVGPEPPKCCWWIKCRQQRTGATLFYMGNSVLFKVSVVWSQAHTRILLKMLSSTHDLALLNFLFLPQPSLTT